jgi:hypothetical protein
MSLPPPTLKPCAECPWRRDSLPGWLGPYNAATWVQLAHSDAAIACHLTIQEDGDWDGAWQCAGAGQYRTNVAKSPRDPGVYTAPEKDTSLVFGSPNEFKEHHSAA